ncbi:IS66 family transposase [Candidatus Uhrbacteria bacterium]|nr:IS66 family transposase [Candidatus Uhrbacteria bacterium]
MKNDLNIQEKELRFTAQERDEWSAVSGGMIENIPVTIELGKLRNEASGLRKRVACIWNAWQSQKQKSAVLEDKVKNLEHDKKTLADEIERLKQENKDLQDKLSAVTEVKDKFQGMIFKSSVISRPKSDNKRGAQEGHRGVSRKRPIIVDSEKEIYLTNCPTCEHPVTQTNTFTERTVTDIPIAKTVVTRYVIQRQWCGHCEKEVSGVPEGTVSGLRFGVTFLSWILIQKYRMRTPLAKIKELAFSLYGLKITEGGVQKLIGTLKKKSGPQYVEILQEIRKAKVKHADETSWRVQGQNHWCWLFATQKAAYYTIEETRGKGVPKNILEGSPQSSVLIRDDYAGYACIAAHHQSCWSHLLRVSHELAVLPHASKEVADLHSELTTLFAELSILVESTFDMVSRQAAHAKHLKQLEAIEARVYQCRDSKKVQTRIRNQHANLLTALLFKNVPLTNNHAERQIRPMALARKISGGSQSNNGASIHAVLMSIVQTMALKGQNIMETLPKILTAQGQRYVVALGKGVREKGKGVRYLFLFLLTVLYFIYGESASN